MRAEDRLDWARRMFEKGYVSKATKVSEELNFEKAKFTLEQAQSKKNVLEKYTKREDDQGAGERGREGPLRRAGQAGDLGAGEGQGGRSSRRRSSNCTLIAPIDGLVVYANDPNRMFGSNQPQIEEGATVRERQKIISIPDISPDAGQRQGPRVA